MINNKTQVLISALSSKKQLAFALLLLDRMLPSLVAFSKDTGFDDSCYLLARNAAWAALRNGVVDQTLNEVCTRSAPDTEEFSHALTSYALNAALAMSEIAEFISDRNPDHIAQVLTYAHDSLYLYLSSLEPSIISTSEEDIIIARRPLMQQEERRQEEDLSFISGLPNQFDDTVILAVEKRAKEQPPLLPSSDVQCQ